MTWNRWRVLFFVCFYAAFALHVALWHHWGKTTIGHLGFGEFFGTLQHGVVTAGTIFSLVIFGHALLFGGWFCGWFCHWGMLQDAAIALMRKVGIQPRMVRVESRIIPWVWFLILIGQVAMVWVTQGLPTTLSWNMSQTAVWSGVPRSIFLICLTSIISGFFLVYLFGDRAFCRTICTFRLWFSWFDRFAPLRIRQTSPCQSCLSECTSCCPMGIDAEGEIRAFGEIKSTACIKCNICIDECPSKSLKIGFSKTGNRPVPSGYTPPAPDILPDTIRLASLFSLLALILGAVKIGGNVSMSLGFILGMIYIRTNAQSKLSAFELLAMLLLGVGLLYRADFNDTTSLGKGLGMIAAFLVLARLFKNTSWQEFTQNHSLQKTSRVAPVILLLGVGILGGRELLHSWNLAQQQASLKAGDFQRLSCLLGSFTHFSDNPSTTLLELGKTRRRMKDLEGAEKAFHQSLQEKPDPVAFCHLFEVQQLLGKGQGAAQTLEKALASFPESPDVLLQAALLALKQGMPDQAESRAIQSLTIDASNSFAHLALAEAYELQGKMDLAETEFRLVLEQNPKIGAPVLARFLLSSRRSESSLPYFAESLRHFPHDPTLHFDQGIAFADTGNIGEAVKSWQKVLEIDPKAQVARDNIEKARQVSASGTLSLPENEPLTK